MNQSLKRYKTLEGAKKAALNEAAELGASIDIYQILHTYVQKDGKRYAYKMDAPIVSYFTIGAGYRRENIFRVAEKCGAPAQSVRRVLEMVGLTEFREPTK